MTCQDCELRLAQEETGEVVEQHLRECAACRTVYQDLAANALALDALRSDELPKISVRIPRRRHMYPWVAAAAAALFALALLVPRIAQRKPAGSTAVSQVVEHQVQPTDPQAPQVRAPEAAKVEPARLRPQKFEPLKIKMLTSDPDVVIYWLIED
ncbi:MAG TPA: hypothetical protein VGG72_14235 [Bryobacteraceae bacterium]|jgi:hypothetical protein